MHFRFIRGVPTVLHSWPLHAMLGLVRPNGFERQGLAEARRNREVTTSIRQAANLPLDLTYNSNIRIVSIALAHRACIINDAVPLAVTQSTSQAVTRRHLIYANRMSECAGAWREGHSGTRQVARDVAMEAPSRPGAINFC